MVRRVALSAMALAVAFCAVASDGLRLVRGEYVYRGSAEMSVAEARHKALERAISSALADEFGMTVSQSSAAVVSNDSHGDSRSRVVMTGGSEVLGEWIETVKGPDYEVSFEADMLVVKATVEGRARSREAVEPSFRAATLRNGVTEACASETFRDGDHLYLGFEATENGSVAVFLSDVERGEVTMLLPGSFDNYRPVAVSTDSPTVFFSSAFAPESGLVDEIDVSADNPVEINDLHVVFSPRRFSLPSALVREPGQLPTISLADFSRWLADSRIADRLMQLKTITISITKLNN